MYLSVSYSLRFLWSEALGKIKDNMNLWMAVSLEETILKII